MRYAEIIAEKSLEDVGVRGQKFYLSATGKNIDLDHFVQTGELVGVKGISSSKYIWSQFGPDRGRDLFFVMDAPDVLRMNNMKRIGYDNPDALIANNSKLLGRILSVSNIAKSICDNLISGVFQKMVKTVGFGGDPIAVSNRATFIAHYLQRGRDFEDEMFKDVDTSKFGDWKSEGLRLSSYDDYANLYYQAAKSAGWYGKDFVKFFAPQNRSKWLPALKAAIVAQANIYNDEEEWSNEGTSFIVPRSSMIIISVPKQYINPEPEKNMFWSKYDDERLAYYQELMETLKRSPFKVRVVEEHKISGGLSAYRSRRWEK